MVRLEFLKYLASLATLSNIPPLYSLNFSDSALRKSSFGNNFYWGVGTSAYQVEGATDVDGKGESIWDRFASQPGNIKDHSDATIANDFYHCYEHDLNLLRSLNFENFRFSFSWSRLLPNGTGRINEKGIDFYNKMIDTSLQLGIEPWAMLYHWDLPQARIEKDSGFWFRDFLK